MYSAVSYVYPETSQVKFGSSSNKGYLTTSELNLSKPFTVIVSAKRYGTDTAQLKVTAGGESQTSANFGAAYATYAFKFDAVGSKEKIRFDILFLDVSHEDLLRGSFLHAKISTFRRRVYEKL